MRVVRKQYTTSINITRLKERNFVTIMAQIEAEAKRRGLTIVGVRSIRRYRSFGAKMDFTFTVRGAEKADVYRFASRLVIRNG